MTFQVRKAEFRLIPNIAFCGKSSSGKTYSALLFARGYVGDQGKIVVIDTENRRSEAYANDPEIGQFDIIEFTAPFTPERYIEAYEAACNHVGENGFVIIDSASHEWEGQGGILEFADQQTNAKGQALSSANKWNVPKRRHAKLVHRIANPIVPTIVCFRIKDKLIDVKNPQLGTTEEIVTEKNFHFDLTTIITLEPKTHKCTIQKLPKPLHGVAVQGCVITKEMGAKYAQVTKSGATGVNQNYAPIEDVYDKITKATTVAELNAIYTENENHPDKDSIVIACTTRKQSLTEQA